MKKTATKNVSLTFAVCLSVLAMSYMHVTCAQEIDWGDKIISERGAKGTDGGVGEAGGNGKSAYIDAEVPGDKDNFKLTAKEVFITANGGNGGAGGTGANGGDGGEAVIGSLRVRDGSNVQMVIPSYIAIAKGGKGGEGKVGGTGGTAWAEGIALENLQGDNLLELNEIDTRAKAGSNGDGSKGDARSTAYAFEVDNVKKLTVTSGAELSFEAKAYDGNSSSTAITLRMMGSNVDYNAKKHLGIYATADIKDEREGIGSSYTSNAEATGIMAVGGTSTINANSVAIASNAKISCAKDIYGASALARGVAASGQELNINAEEISIAAVTDNGKNNIVSRTQAEAMWLENSKVRLNAEEKLAIAAWSFAIGDANVHKSADVIGVYAYNSELDFNSGELLEIGTIKNHLTEEENVYALVGVNNSKISMKAAEKINITGDIALMNDSSLELAVGSASYNGISVKGNVLLSGNSLLKLHGNTYIGGSSTAMQALFSVNDETVLNIDKSALLVDGITRVDGNATMNNAKLYFYDEKQMHSDDFHVMAVTGSLNVEGQNEIFLRADSSKESNLEGVGEDFKLNSDVLGVGKNITGDGKFDVTIFDQGMKNGYGMGEDGEKTLDNKIIIIYNPKYEDGVEIQSANSSSNLINSVKVVNYDNGIWNYAYSMEAKQDGDNVVINKVNISTQAAPSQLTLHSANTAAAANAVSVLGNDNALHEHLCEAHENGTHEEVWAKYLGGKVKAEGAQVKYNGVELGYDAYVGNDWTFGVSGMQVRGNTQLDNGSGKVKTNVGTLYGQWHGGGEYVNIKAKAGCVSSESFMVSDRKVFDRNVFEKINGEFSAPAYSLSVEYGKKIALANNYFIEPTAKLSYVHMGASDYNVKVTDMMAHIANDSFDSFAVRGGLKMGKNLGERGNFYVKAMAVYDFAGDVATRLVDEHGRSAYYEDSLGGLGFEYGAGVDYHLSKASKLTLDVERRSGDLKRDWGVNVGVSYSF